MLIQSIEQLRAIYASPKERAVKKQLPALDIYCRQFIGLSPFVVLGSQGADDALDASPRGGPPGFVKVTGAGQLLIPDSPGNNRLDTLENIIQTGRIGMLFIIPGVDETLRVNGQAKLTTAIDLLKLCTSELKPPKLVIQVDVTQAYLHCAKAFMRSKLWDTSKQIDRGRLPTMGEMIGEQTGMADPPETQAEMLERYKNDL
jgi:PPOX class probable FMN-dependent enzyme